MKLALILFAVISLAYGTFTDRYGRVHERFARNSEQPANEQPVNERPRSSKPMRMYRYYYRGPKSGQQDIQSMIDNLPALTAPQGGYVQRSYRIRTMPMVYQPVIEVEEEPEPEVEEEPEPEPAAPVMNFFQKIMKQTSGRLEPVNFQQETTTPCAWENLGTKAANNLIEAAMEQRGGYYTLVALRRRQESISTRCDGENSCTTDHKATVTFIISDSDQCPYQAKCQCRQAQNANTVTCTASGDVSEDFSISGVELSCDDDEEEVEEASGDNF